jgi:hypothetical protein
VIPLPNFPSAVSPDTLPPPTGEQPPTAVSPNVPTINEPLPNVQLPVTNLPPAVQDSGPGSNVASDSNPLPPATGNSPQARISTSERLGLSLGLALFAVLTVAATQAVWKR